MAIAAFLLVLQLVEPISMTDAEYTATIRACWGDYHPSFGKYAPREEIDLPPGTLHRVSDSTIVQVILAPTWRDAPVYSARPDPLLVGMWVRRLREDGTTEDGIQLPDGTLWIDRGETGKQRFGEYYYVGVR